MVGYVLGLGDRHPSNLMLDRKSGKVMHCDYGDCFEVAQHRKKYPERVPFRFTRMIAFATEVPTVLTAAHDLKSCAWHRLVDICVSPDSCVVVDVGS